MEALNINYSLKPDHISSKWSMTQQTAVDKCMAYEKHAGMSLQVTPVLEVFLPYIKSFFCNIIKSLNNLT